MIMFESVIMGKGSKNIDISILDVLIWEHAYTHMRIYYYVQYFQCIGIYFLYVGN